MNPQDFCYWLQGHFELCASEGDSLSLTRSQVSLIQEHLALVFEKKTGKPTIGTACFGAGPFESSDTLPKLPVVWAWDGVASC